PSRILSEVCRPRSGCRSVYRLAPHASPTQEASMSLTEHSSLTQPPIFSNAIRSESRVLIGSMRKFGNSFFYTKQLSIRVVHEVAQPYPREYVPHVVHVRLRVRNISIVGDEQSA